MKKTFLLFAASLAALVSCDSSNIIPNDTPQKETEEKIETEENTMTPIQLNIAGQETKALAASSNEKAINTLQVLVYTKNDAGTETYDSYYTFDGNSDDYVIYIDPNRTDVSEYRFAAYVNQPVLNDETYTKDWALFSNESTTNFQMYGEKTYTVTDLKKTYTANITVARQCSRVEVKEIAVDWTNSVNSRKSFKLKSMYLMDVQGAFRNHYDIPESVSKNYDLWYNKNGYTTTPQDNLLYDKINDAAITEDTSYSTDHFFYGYISDLTTYNEDETWEPGGTRLVIEAEFDGKLCYYAIRLNGLNNTPIQTDIRNKEFIFNKITITKPGSEKPYSKLPEESPVEVSVTVQEWQPGFSGDYTVQ